MDSNQIITEETRKTVRGGFVVLLIAVTTIFLAWASWSESKFLEYQAEAQKNSEHYTFQGFSYNQIETTTQVSDSNNAHIIGGYITDYRIAREQGDDVALYVAATKITDNMYGFYAEEYVTEYFKWDFQKYYDAWDGFNSIDAFAEYYDAWLEEFEKVEGTPIVDLFDVYDVYFKDSSECLSLAVQYDTEASDYGKSAGKYKAVMSLYSVVIALLGIVQSITSVKGKRVLVLISTAVVAVSTVYMVLFIPMPF